MTVSAGEKDALINGVELGIDYGIDIPEEDMKLYEKYISEMRGKDHG